MATSSTFVMVDQAKTNLKKLETYITTGMENCLDLSLDLVEHQKESKGDTAQCDSQVTSLKTMMMSYLEMQRELNHFIEATETVKKQARESMASEDNSRSDFELLLDTKLKELKDGCQGDNLKQHDRYVEMEQKIDDIRASDEAAMDTEKEPTQIDDDLAMTQEVVTRCPYTGKDMRDPVQNKRCKHNYERDGINEAMKHRKSKTKCPVPGCIDDRPISAADLEDNHDLRRYIEKKNRSHNKK